MTHPRIHYVLIGQTVTACRLDAEAARTPLLATNAIPGVTCSHCRVQLGFRSYHPGWRTRAMRVSVERLTSNRPTSPATPG